MHCHSDTHWKNPCQVVVGSGQKVQVPLSPIDLSKEHVGNEMVHAINIKLHFNAQNFADSTMKSITHPILSTTMPNLLSVSFFSTPSPQ
jgi:hypothetical protein